MPAPASLPPASAQAAIVLGFLSGTWTLVDGFHLLITGQLIRLLGVYGPWSGWGAGAVLLGAAWMLVGNLYLFQNRRRIWAAMIALVLVSAWSAGPYAELVLLAQLILLLLPSTRRGLRSASA